MKSSKPIQDFLINGLMDLNILDMQGLLNYDPAYAKACCEDENYKNEINPEVLSKKIFESINYYLTFELTKHQSSATIQYSYKHKLKLIERFIPIIETFGKTDIAFLKAMEAHPVCGCEITKSIRSIETAKDLLRAKITDLYNEIEIKWQQSNADDDLYGFFNKIKEGKITSLEVNNYIKKITDNYSSKKLKALNEEFYHFFSLLQESRLMEYVLFENKENIPFKRYLNEDKLSLITESDDKNLVDDNGYLFPNEFSGCYEFQELLDDLLRKASNKKINTEINPNHSNLDEDTTEKFTTKAEKITDADNDNYLQTELLKKKMNFDRLKENLAKNGFFNLEMVNSLTETNKQKLVKLLIANGLPYSIAMFEYLGFIKYLGKNHFHKNKDRDIEISKWFSADANDRSVRGNINVLYPSSTEDKNRYTAHLHKETVKNDYQSLK